MARFDEYNEQRNKQPKNQRQNEFKLSDIRRLFGIQATTIDRAICDGQIKPSIGKVLIDGRWVRLFSYDDIKHYFDGLKGLYDGKPTSTMGTQNVQ